MVALIGLFFLLIVLLSCLHGFSFVYSDATGFHLYIPTPRVFTYIFFRCVFSTYSANFDLHYSCTYIAGISFSVLLCRVWSELFVSCLSTYSADLSFAYNADSIF